VALVAPLMIWFFPKRTVIFVFFTFIFTPAVCFNILFHAGATAAFGVYCPGLITALTLYGKSREVPKVTMITLNIFYPFKEGSRFDMDYYLNTHIPMSIQRLGNALKGVVIEAGVAGTEPGAPRHLPPCATCALNRSKHSSRCLLYTAPHYRVTLRTTPTLSRLFNSAKRSSERNIFS
jgi:hypothetical protein